MDTSYWLGAVDVRNGVCAVENCLVWDVGPNDQRELALGRWQPVGASVLFVG